MTIVRETRIYDGPGGPFEGVAAWDGTIEGKRPAVLVLPNVLGQKEADNLKAEALAGLGYVALAADVYGQGRRTTRQSENPARYMNEMNADRGLLRERLFAALEELKSLPQADPERLGAIGFCFGGKCVLDLARSGAPLRGGVSFHGVFDRPDYPTAGDIGMKLLLCHGWDDPLAKPDAVLALARELSEAGADWQLHAYGHTVHAFTDAGANLPEKGAVYSERADARSWKAMTDFLAECFAS